MTPPYHHPKPRATAGIGRLLDTVHIPWASDGPPPPAIIRPTAALNTTRWIFERPACLFMRFPFKIVFSYFSLL